MRKLITIFTVLISVNSYSQNNLNNENDSNLISKMLDYNYKIDSLQKKIDSISNHTDSIYQLILQDNRIDSIRLKYDKEYRLKHYKKLILGSWTDNETENATFAFYEDSIFYVDALKSYKCTVKNDSIKIFFDNLIEPFKILKLSKDSLILKSQFGIDRYGKFTN